MSEKKDYIERGALMKLLKKDLRECEKDAEECGGEAALVADGIGDAIARVKDFPAAEVEPVVLGEWKWVESGVWICTHCKTRRYTNTSRYCPECGAHMGRSGSGE